MTTLADLHDDEVRVRDAATGGEKGAKVTQLGALDPVALILLGRVAGMGALKYAAHNFLKGYDWSLSFNAMQRHALLFWSGETYDYCTTPGHPVRQYHPYVPKDVEAGPRACNASGLPHIAHAAWMALSLVSFVARGIGNDDRPPALASDPLQGIFEVLTQQLSHFPVGPEDELMRTVGLGLPFGSAPFTGTDMSAIEVEPWGTGDGPVIQPTALEVEREDPLYPGMPD